MTPKQLSALAHSKGYRWDRTNGTHAVWVKRYCRSIVIPIGRKEVKPGLAKTIARQIRQSDIDRQQADIIRDRLMGGFNCYQFSGQI